MLNIILNVRNAVSSDVTILSVFNKLWAAAPITNTSSVYAFCVLVIAMCMYATGCRNLIYKVLNLAVLSVFVVALWAYLTDVTFIYVVYILTFVSAVVMLFLSVVLMLPSSAISVSKKNGLLLLAVSTQSHMTLSGFLIGITKFLLVTIFMVIIIYWLYAAYKTTDLRNSYEIYGHPKTKVNLIHKPGLGSGDNETGWHLAAFHFYYTLFVYADPEANKQAIKECYIKDAIFYNNINPSINAKVENDKIINDKSPMRYRSGDRFAALYQDADFSRFITGIQGYSGDFPVYIRVVPNLILGYEHAWYDHRWTRAFLMLLHEFTDFYFRMLEPKFLLRQKWYRNLTFLPRRFVGMPTDISKGRLAGFWYDENGWRAQCRFKLNGNLDQKVVMVLYRPWWSPFQVFRKEENTPLVTRVLSDAFEKVINSRVFAWLGNTAKFLKNAYMSSPKYAREALDPITRHLRSGLHISARSAESGNQAFSSLSIFLLSTPLGNTSAVKLDFSVHSISQDIGGHLENLAAIQHELYVTSPLLMLVSVTGLLVALIGAPLFVAPGHTAKKVPHRH